MDGKAPRTRKKASFVRKLLWLAAVGVVLVVALVASAPWLLGTAPVRAYAVSRLNRVLQPSRVSVAGVSASWRGPITLRGLTLRNEKGKVLIAARRATLNRGLIALARDHARLGTLTVEDAAVDIERRADGSIDLVEALVPPASGPATGAERGPAPAKQAGPGIEIALKVLSGTLRLATPELAEPLVAGSLAMEARLPAAPGQPLDWKVRLAKPPGGTEAETLGVDGTYDFQGAAESGLSVMVKGENWPLVAKGAGASVRGRLVGGLSVERKGVGVKSAGDARLVGFEAGGAALAGDVLRFDAVGGTWDVSSTADGWAVRRLDLKAPGASLQASGSVPTAGELPTARVVGDLDLAALARQVPHTLHLREGLTLDRGKGTLSLDLTSAAGTQTVALEAHVSDLAARHGGKAFALKEAATVDAKGSHGPGGFAVESLRVKTAFLDVHAKGDLEHGVVLSGFIDLNAIETQFHDLIDFRGVELAGKGRMAGDYRKTGPTFVGRYATELHKFRVAGLTAEPVEREVFRFDAAANGPIGPTGLPTGFDIAKVNLKSSRDAVSVAAQNRPEWLAVTASASTPLAVSAREGQAEVKLAGKWRGESSRLELDELRLGLKPTDPALAGPGALALAAKGVLDLKADEVMLTPLPGPAGAAFALGAEGMKVHGLRTIPLVERAGRVTFVGDLAALDRALTVWTGSEPNGYGGGYGGMVGMGPGEAGSLNFGLEVNVDDLSRLAAGGKERVQEGPVTVAGNGKFQPGVDRIDINKLVVGTQYARVDAEGALGEPMGRRVAALKGTIDPNWRTLSRLIAAATEPNARATGRARAFRLEGLLSGPSLATILKGLDAEIGLDLTSADLFGMKLGPAPVVVRCGGGDVTINPIETTLNGGTVRLKTGLDVDETKGIALLLFSGTAVEGAQINDEVSRRVLRYVAPVLDKATHVSGKINLTVADGLVPLSGPPERTMTLDGQLVFQDVTFAPGPFAEKVLSVTGKANSPGLKIHQPVNLSIANSRVIQKGLDIPIGQGAALGLEGSVGFDQTLDLRASVPITKGMLGQAAGLDSLVAGNRVTVPIGGTVSEPRINRQALQVALRGLSQELVKKGLKQETNGLLDRLGVPAPADGATPADAAQGIEEQLLKRLLPPRGRNGGVGR